MALASFLTTLRANSFPCDHKNCSNELLSVTNKLNESLNSNQNYSLVNFKFFVLFSYFFITYEYVAKFIKYLTNLTYDTFCQLNSCLISISQLPKVDGNF